MGIIEIWIPELIIVIFLALPLFRPFFKILWALDGLVWLPIIAMGIAVGLFPAYGFRPECLPLLVFAFFFNIANLPAFFASVISRPNDSFRDRGPWLTILALILLGVATVPMFAFSSMVYEKTEDETDVKVIKLSNRVLDSTGVYNREYSLRVSGNVQLTRPLIFLVPPEIGSAASVDLVCMELQKRDFSVVTYSSKDNYVVKKKNAFPLKPLLYLQVLQQGTDFASANERGKALETERQAEVEFLLSRLPSALGFSKDADLPPILLAGYGAGGSALAYLAGENDFITRYDNVLGAVAIESRLWSSYLPETGNANVRLPRGIISRRWALIVNGVQSILPQKVSNTGTLPSAGLPVLYLVSGRALMSVAEAANQRPVKGQTPYQAIFNAVRSSSGPVALAAIEGAGPLDYQDFPFTHPIYSFLLPGLKDAEKSEYPIGDTASIIGNFASLLLMQAAAQAENETTEELEPMEIEAAEAMKEPAVNIPPHYAISGKLYTESRNFSRFWL